MFPCLRWPLGSHKAFCFVDYDPMTSGDVFLNEARPPLLRQAQTRKHCLGSKIASRTQKMFLENFESIFCFEDADFVFSSVQCYFTPIQSYSTKVKIIYLQAKCTIGYKITKKQFSKHYLVISYDQRYSKSYFNVIRRNSYVSIQLIWKEPSPPLPPPPVTMSGKRVLVLYILKAFQVIQRFRICIKLAIDLLNEVNICNTVLQF